MPTVIFAPDKDAHHDGSLRKQTQGFLEKLYTDDTTLGLHIEPIQNSADPRVRTGRVNQNFRAVLFKLAADGGEPHYVFSGVWPHDKAIEVARRSVLQVNPVNGLPELLTGSPPETDTPETDTPETGTPETGTPETGTPGPGGTAEQPAAPRGPEPSGTTGSSRSSWLESVSPGTTLTRLRDELGLADGVAQRAMAATSEDEVFGVAQQAAEWQGMALLDLASGRTIEEVRASLGLDETTRPDPGLSEDEQLLAAMRTPAGRMQFAWLEDDEELRRVVEGGDFEQWRTFLHPQQRTYAERSYNGAFRLSGGAGTGKTVVLLHRARMLARRDPQARIVLTTFTRNLAEGLRQQLRILDPELPLASALGEPGIHISGVDAAAHRTLAQAQPADHTQAVEAVLGVGGNRATQRLSNWHRAWREAIGAVSALPEALRSPAFLATEYAHVVLPHRIRTREDYLRVRRPGRGVPLGRAQRNAVWETVESYRSSCALDETVDFPEVCAIAAELCAGALGRLADHVLVDEGQDLTPPQWQFLRSLVADGPDDLFIAEDPQQRIYGQQVTLGHYGIRIVGRSRRLTLNYRTTQQVLRFATGVLAGSTYAGLEEDDPDNTGFRSARSGPQPRRLATSSLSEELDQACTVVGEWLDEGVRPDTIGILVRDQRLADQVSRGLADRNLGVRLVTRSAATGKQPQLMTMHRAKGMEFSRVLIAGAEAGVVPAAYLLQEVPEEEHDDVLQRERSLFYVAATRARDELVVMWRGERSSLLGAEDP